MIHRRKCIIHPAIHDIDEEDEQKFYGDQIPLFAKEGRSIAENVLFIRLFAMLMKEDEQKFYGDQILLFAKEGRSIAENVLFIRLFAILMKEDE